ncbi:MAG TPA: cytochrome P450 [Thermoanaerobaculia bacterium]|nr:cytochrome P450 [Thermoanaerobaculia bacterium]
MTELIQDNLPGPRGGLKIEPGANRLAAYLDAIRRHGEIFCVSETETSRLFLVSHPEHVKHVLQDNQANYRQNTRKKILMGGKSLALSAGEAWRQRRRLMQPVFNQQRLAALAPKMVAGTERMVERWREPARRGEPLDVAEEMIGLTLELLIESLLGAAVDRGGLRKTVTTAFEYFNDRARNPRTLPVAIPTPRNLRLLKSLRDLKKAVAATISSHIESGEPAGDLLSMMLAARDSQTGEEMNPEQLLDELMMLLVMGHMTTAMAATWTWFMLSRQPEADERVRAEIAEVVGDRPAEFKDVAGLVYTRMVIEETLRLYPPSWGFGRFVIGDDEIGGYRIPAGSVVTLSPWVTHRRPELWTEPDRFDPERFNPARSGERSRFAYYPFGGGPRVCIARDMALMELPLILATVAQRYRLRAVAGHAVVPVQGITLRPRGGLRMTLADAKAPEGPATPPRTFATLPELLLDEKPAAAPAFLAKVDGEYVPVARAELLDRAGRLATALAALGIVPGERLALISRNSPEWAMADLAALAAGGVTVPLQGDLTTDDAIARMRDSGARTVLASAGRLADLLPRRGELPDVRLWLQLDGHAALGEGVTTLRSLLDSTPKSDVAALVRQRRPEEPATVLYTPGTTGDAKAIVLSHANLAAAVHGLAEALPIRAGDTAFSYLSLSRPAERALLYACLHRGATVAFASAPETPDLLDEELRQVKPHFFSSTPDFWKRQLNWLFHLVQASSPRRRKFFQWSVQVSRAALPFRVQQRRPTGRTRWQLPLADRLVWKVVRERLGGRLRFAVSGGDRLAHGWITLLWAAGLQIYETYGLAEASGVVTVNRPKAVRLGTSGSALPGVEVRVAGDGEILVRGGTVTAHGDDGWLHTGDAGFFDDAGMLNVLGRQADLYLGAEGKRVSPAGLETLLKGSHFVTHALVVGAGRPNNAALLVPDFGALQRMARKRGIAYNAVEELVHDPRVREVLAQEVKGVNDKLAAHDKIQAWDLVPRELTTAAGELTAAGTLRRGVVTERYKAEIESLYRT